MLSAKEAYDRSIKSERENQLKIYKKSITRAIKEGKMFIDVDINMDPKNREILKKNDYKMKVIEKPCLYSSDTKLMIRISWVNNKE